MIGTSKNKRMNKSNQNTTYTPIYDCLNVYGSALFFDVENTRKNSCNRMTENNGEPSSTNTNTTSIGGNFKILECNDMNNKTIVFEWHPKPCFYNGKYHDNVISSGSSFSLSDASIEQASYINPNEVGSIMNDEVIASGNIHGKYVDDECFHARGRCHAMISSDKIFQNNNSPSHGQSTRENDKINTDGNITFKHCTSLNKIPSKTKNILTSESLLLGNRCNSNENNNNHGSQRSSSFFLEERFLKISPYVDDKCLAYYSIYREYNHYMSLIKICVSERNHDCGYIIIYNIDGLSKTFTFLRGGLKKLISHLNNFKWLKRRRSITQHMYRKRNEIRYKNIHNMIHDESILYNSKLIDNSVINKPVTTELFKTLFNDKGQLIDVYNFKRFGYLYGFEKNVRVEAWKFIFGFYAFSSTTEERTKTQASLNNEYILLSKIRNNDTDLPTPFLSTIEKDVIRTDRKNPFYSGDNNPNLIKMKNILLNYSYYRPNIGYSQGMSDLLAPILSLLKEESDSFWCFVGFMETLLSATLPSEERMDHMMYLLLKLMEQICPDILKFLRRNELELSMIFLHRWFILSFQREFSTEDSIRIWEACWFCPILDNGYFQIFVAIAIMMKYHKNTKCKRSIFYHTSDEILYFFTNIIKFSNANDVLSKARKLIGKIKFSNVLPCELRVFLFSPIGWNNSSLPNVNCNCLNQENCIYKNWTLNNKMEKLIIDSIKSFHEQHPAIGNQLQNSTNL